MIDKIKHLFGRSQAASMIAVLAAIAVAGWITGYLPSSNSTSSQLEAARLEVPTWQPFVAGEMRQHALSVSQFSANPDDAAAAPATPVAEAPVEPTADGGWRFMGTLLHNNTLAAVIMLEGTSKSLVVGPDDSLPNGEKIERIDSERLVYLHDSDRRELRLFERIEK